MNPTEKQQRRGYIAGLRALADVLEAHPDVPAPDYGSSQWQPLRWVITSGHADQKAVAAAIVRAVGGSWQKTASGMDGELFMFGGRLAGLHVDVLADREAVCRRIVTGTRTVTKTVPAPDAPTVQVTETVEDVEWICEPLLAEVAS